MSSEPNEFTVSQAREQFSDLLNRAIYRNERIPIKRRNKRVAYVISAEDFALLEALEDKHDLQDALEALADPTEAATPLADVRKRLGL
jgi:prevent-host-death family protein